MNKGAYYVVELLQSFDRKELKDLEAIANCNYFNTEKKVIVLLGILIKKISNEKALTENSLVEIYNELYNAKLSMLNSNQLSNVYAKMSLLHSLIQQYLMLVGLQKSEKTKANLLQAQLLERKQYRSFQKFIKTQRKILEKAEFDVEFYEHQFVIEQGVLSYAQLRGSLNKQNNIISIKDSLSLFYLLHQLDAYLLELYLSELTTTHQIDIIYYQALEPLLKLPQFEQHPLLLVYQSVIKLMETKTDAAFLQLVKDLDLYGKAIPKDNLINFYNTLLNFCFLQHRKGKLDYLKHQLSLYQLMDENNLLLTDDQMHVSNLYNIVSISCKVEAFDWAIEMLDKYYDYLPSHLANEVKDFNLGIIAFYKKNYQVAIDYLFHLTVMNPSQDLNRRNIVMKAYYELDTDYKETTQTLFRSFEKYIRDHKSLTSKSKTSYKNFIRTLINLYRIKHNATKMQLESVKIKLKAQKLNSNKSWLEEKIEELEKG